ncbi:pentatricopeptide repeat-containing protein At3g20730-like [Euphorbia lathyris]|uniref:pentatricopeptide repeat-containing protein At3g20730-like n=1 Tax=Euphorbia lathyris TaxID=212925 RepID=UPI00331401C8
MRTARTAVYNIFLCSFFKQQFHSSCNPVGLTYLDAALCMKTLQLCTETKAATRGRLVHNHIIRHGFGSDINLSNKLIIFYVRLGNVIISRKVFDGMAERNVVSWTAQISGYVKEGCYHDALSIFLEMARAGVRANQFTYGSVLRACTGLKYLKGGMQIQGCIEKSRFVGNLFVQSALVDLYSKCGNMKEACYLFGTMPERDVVCWNTMIGGFAVQGFTDESFQMFRSMMRQGVIPDCFTFGSVLKASRTASDLVKVYQVHGVIIQLGFESYSDLNGSMIDAYAKCESIRSAYDVYNNMRKKDAISFTALMTGCARDSSYSRMALDLFKEIEQINMEIDDVTFCSMFNICANTACLSMGRQIHALALKNKSNYDIATGNALVHMYAKSGEIEDATRAFHEMTEKNVISWTSLITGYGKNGYGHEAIALFKKMECEGLKPNAVTFLSLLFACSHSGLTSEGLECFSNMIKNYDISPQVEHFSCMIDLFARGGQLEEAYNMICKMNFQPNASLWGAILGACSIYGNKALGEVAATQLFHINPENSVNYVALASIYAATGAWDDAWKMRKFMEERSLKKTPGYSMVDSTKNNMLVLQPSLGLS